MLDFSRRLTVSNAVGHLINKAMSRDRPFVARMRNGPRFEIRPPASGNNDYGVAYEIFVHGFYRHRGAQNPESVRLVVDMGANVGLSVLHFLHQYPNCSVIAFEPHPSHAAQVIRNLEFDGTRARVELHAKAAGAASRVMRLTDERSSSTLTDDASPGTLPVETTDVFPLLEGKRIDVLKMDMEGGEYEVMADDRFPALNIGAILMEWHARADRPKGGHWCEERLRGMGYMVGEIFTRPDHGMLWAVRGEGGLSQETRPG